MDQIIDVGKLVTRIQAAIIYGSVSGRCIIILTLALIGIAFDSPSSDTISIGSVSLRLQDDFGPA